jgi:cytoskeletal protein CcmA (bactofilin family)
MWKKEDAKLQGVSPSSATPASTAPASSATPISAHAASAPLAIAALPVSPRAAACISQGIKIKGELTGSEDLFVDGLVDGKLNLANGSLTIGPNGHVKADVIAREVIVRGKVEGKVLGRDKVQLWSTGHVAGEVQTERLSIEEGALLRGKVEAGKQPSRSMETKAAPATLSKPAEPTSLSSGTVAN